MDISPQKKLRGSILDNVNNRTSITCTNVPDGLFEAKVAEKHFSKFGRVQRIRLHSKKHMCIIEYDHPSATEKAVLNAGAFDGFMFDVTRTKPRMRRKSSKDEDPDWVPDPEVEQELNAMGGIETYRVPRKKLPAVGPSIVISKARPMATPMKKKTLVTTPKHTKPTVMSQPVNTEPTIVVTATTLSNKEAALELDKLRSRVSITADEKWRTLDARDRILRAWGGAGSRVKVGGATIGACPDMCPEKELLHRQSEHQVMTLETIPGSDGVLEPWRAVKQYSRSSADQEIPMCYELRPAEVLMRTCSYLLYEIADTNRQVSLADWFHFMWDRFRGIRKDITQQALCCAESIKMVEICARFHAHCAARLADLEHTQFDQKLNTDNLTKCLQTLKHMYADVSAEYKPNEAEFRGYIALLNLGDANFWWEIKQLPYEIQKSESIMFALQIYASLDNNNYVRFFRLVQEKATYLQACILLRYFNDVRARALARIVKAYAPRGSARYPAEDMMSILAFETIESMKSFINHYGLRFAKNEEELTIILNRNQFIEDSDPHPLSRAINLIESKRQNTVGEIISGGQMPVYDFENLPLYSSFNIDGRLKEIALLAEDLGYNTINDSGKDIQGLKLELRKLTQEGRVLAVSQKIEPRKTLFTKPEDSPRRENVFSKPAVELNSNINKFSFQPAIPVAPTEVITDSPEKVLLDSPKNIFTFSKPQKTETNMYQSKLSSNLFTRPEEAKYRSDLPKTNIFASSNNSKNVFEVAKSAFKPPESSVFKKPVSNSVFGQPINKSEAASGNIFTKSTLFPQSDPKHIFSTGRTNVFGKLQESNDESANIFTKPLQAKPSNQRLAPSIFGSAGNAAENAAKCTFKLGNNTENTVPHSNGDPSTVTSPGSLFKSANQPSFPANKFSIFQSKNKAQTVADNILDSVKAQTDVYDFDPSEVDNEKLEQDNKQKMKEEEMKRQEEIKRLEAEKLALQRKEEERRREEQRKIEEAKKQEEIRKKEEAKKQEELKQKMEEIKRIELKRIAEEKERKFKERVDKESQDLIEELNNEIEQETVSNILKEELDDFNKLLSYAREFNESITMELLNGICSSELKAEIFRTQKVMKKWYYIWRKHFIRNYKRRSLLEDTPLWLPDRSPLQEARLLKRRSEKSALDNMNAIHRGYRFVGELKQLPSPKPYNILDIIRSPLIKRMKQIEYPYDKCFFWKALLVSPGAKEYLYRKINVRKWIQDVFSDGKTHDISDCLIHVGKESWNRLMDFAISVSLLNKDSLQNSNEALNGANGVLCYVTENDSNTDGVIELILKQKHPYQILPVAIIMPNNMDRRRLEDKLQFWQNNNVISAFRIFNVESVNVDKSIDSCTKSALKWLSRNYPKPPPLEIDYLKSICQRYLGNEIWARLKSEKDERTNDVLKDLQKLVTCYNTVVDKLCHVITDEDLFNYPSFPLEFVRYLDSTSPYPKPYEFIPSSAKQTDNTNFIKRLMHKLKLPDPSSKFLPKTILNMQEQIGKYCKQIGWFSNPDDVMCKVVALIPQELCEFNMPHEISDQYFEQFDLVDILNVIVYEKINSLDNFDNRLAVYMKPALEKYRNTNLFLEVDVYARAKHKALEYEDDIDHYIEAKRRKIASDSMEQLILEDKDCSLVEDNIQMAEQSIYTFNSCQDAVSDLEKQLDEEKKKSDQLENLLMMALSNV